MTGINTNKTARRLSIDTLEHLSIVQAAATHTLDTQAGVFTGPKQHITGKALKLAVLHQGYTAHLSR